MVSPVLGAAELVSRHALARSTRAVETSLERLATGKRINRASDDPAGSVAVTNLKGDERELQGRIEALLQEDAYLGARDGAQSVLSDLLIELQGLVVTGANRDALSDAERRGLQIEVDSILQTIDHLSNTSRFKSEQILQGFSTSSLGRGTLTREAGDGEPETIAFSLADLARGGKLNLIDGDTEAAQRAVTSAAGTISGSRAAIGARGQAVDAEIRAARKQLEETSKARSQIEDTDYARETAELVRNQVLQSAALFATELASEQLRTLMEGLLG
ncbi:MAG: flagellin [Phycisphaerales bacterium]